MDPQERSRWTVLVVDDDDIHRYATRRMLASQGFGTLEAADGEQALAMARQADAVVLDVAMPAMSGLDVCVALRELDKALELVIIQYSGVFTTTTDRVTGLRAGADAYLTKSSDDELLVANLDAQLRKRDRLRLLEADRQAAVERDDQARDLFLAVIGHDLRGPMQAVTMSAQLLLRSEPRADETLRTAARILTSSARITQMLDDLHDYALVRIGGGLVLCRESVDLSELVQSCVEEARAAHPAARFEIEGDAPSGMWDRGKLFRVVMNLLRDAVQHGIEAEPIVVRIGHRAEGAFICVINAGALDHRAASATEMASTASPEGRRSSPGNLGLGLYICREIVQAHQGQITLESEHSRTTVKVSLPTQAPSTT